jgi:hypothetical protein
MSSVMPNAFGDGLLHFFIGHLEHCDQKHFRHRASSMVPFNIFASGFLSFVKLQVRDELLREKKEN